MSFTVQTIELCLLQAAGVHGGCILRHVRRPCWGHHQLLLRGAFLQCCADSCAAQTRLLRQLMF